jgi:hypothetical protein
VFRTILGTARFLVERRLRLAVEQPLLDRRMILAGLYDVLVALNRRVLICVKDDRLTAA